MDKFFNDYWQNLIIFLTGIIAIVLFFVSDLEQISTSLHGYLDGYVNPDKDDISTEFSGLIALLSILLISFISLSIYFYYLGIEDKSDRCKDESFSSNGTLDEYEGRFEKSVHRARRITRNIYPGGAYPEFKVVSTEIKVNITEEVTKFSRKEVIKPTCDSVYFIPYKIYSDEKASKVEELESIGFSCEDGSSKEVDYLITRNESNLKEVAIFFLPRMKDNEDIRKVITNYKWPGFFNTLFELGEDIFRYHPPANSPIDKLRVEFQIPTSKTPSVKHTGHISNFEKNINEKRMTGNTVFTFESNVEMKKEFDFEFTIKV